MEWARKWCLVNGFLVASALRVVFGLQTIIFVERTLTNADRRGTSCWTRFSNFATAHDGGVRELFMMIVVLLSSCVGFGCTYWHWSDETSLTNGIIAPNDCPSQNCAKSKQAFNMEVIIAFALPLLVTVSIYLYRWNSRAMIGSLNRSFRFIYNHQKFHHSQRQCCAWDQYGRLVMKQVFEVMALGVLWLNLRPLSRTKYGDDVEDYRVGKLIASMGSMLPAVVCLLVSIEMGINFSFIARTLTTLNWFLDSLVRHNDTNSFTKPTQVKHIRYLNVIPNKGEISTRNSLRKFIAEYDELGHFTVEMVAFYSPSLLLILGMHFVLFTMQVSDVAIYFSMPFTTSKTLPHFTLLLSKVVIFLIFYNSPLIYSSSCATDKCHEQRIDDMVEILCHLSLAYENSALHNGNMKEIDKTLTILSLIVNKIRNSINLYDYFDLDRSLVMTIIASTCSYLIVLIQVM
uniref:Gustatory receptor n=1 Tax=Anopheles epiroticus TaxID=199890 RepID=A0A182PNG4_9DIPT